MATKPPGSIGIEAQSLYCPKCQKAQPVRMKLLLCLPGADKYAYYCQVCGEELGSKLQEPAEGPTFFEL